MPHVPDSKSSASATPISQRPDLETPSARRFGRLRPTANAAVPRVGRSAGDVTAAQITGRHTGPAMVSASLSSRLPSGRHRGLKTPSVCRSRKCPICSLPEGGFLLVTRWCLGGTSEADHCLSVPTFPPQLVLPGSQNAASAPASVSKKSGSSLDHTRLAIWDKQPADESTMTHASSRGSMRQPSSRAP
jgi:hypothetical protein